MLFSPYIPSPEENHQALIWTDDACKLFYAQERRRHCSATELMELWLVAPCCEDCIQNEVGYSGQLPDIVSDGWEIDILIELGGATLRLIQETLSNDPDYGPSCKLCEKSLKPWDGDDIHILRYHLEEHYGIPMETKGKKPSKRLRRLILMAYGESCFDCGTAEEHLKIDHIRPQSKGGDSAFRNLQPLCEPCNDKKADTLPTKIEVISDIYFGPYPADSYEGLFW